MTVTGRSLLQGPGLERLSNASLAAYHVAISLPSHLTRRFGSADLPLHHGRVPPWLRERMTRLWLSEGVTSFVDAPHAAIDGRNAGVISPTPLRQGSCRRASKENDDLRRAGGSARREGSVAFVDADASAPRYARAS
jgi:hypothetical protein